MEDLNRAATAGIEPDLVIVVDVDDTIAQARAADSPDRLEAEGTDFHAAVRAAYRTLAAERDWVSSTAAPTSTRWRAWIWEHHRAAAGKMTQ